MLWKKQPLAFNQNSPECRNKLEADVRKGITKQCEMVVCVKCKKEIDKQGNNGYAASISGSIMGDEYSETYFFCKHCGVYTLEVCHDRFLGEESISINGPIPKEEGDAQVALIQKCSEPWNKKCRCEAHMEYFRGNLD